MKSETTRSNGEALSRVLDAIASYRAANGRWPQAVTMSAEAIGMLVSEHLTPKGWSLISKKIRFAPGVGLVVAGAKEALYDYEELGPHKQAGMHDVNAWLGIDAASAAVLAPTQTTITVSAPQYPACRSLPVVLGAQDSYINLSEVALRVVESLVKAGVSGTDFGDTLARHMKIQAGFDPWPKARLNGHSFAIAQVITVADSFFKRFGREYRGYKQLASWRSQVGDNQLDALSAIAENIKAPAKATLLAAPEYDLIQYYREIRNRAIHQLTDDLVGMHNQLIARHGQYFKANYGNEPSEPEAVGYSDFMLLTRAVKVLGRLLNKVSALSAEEILRFHLERDEKNPPGKLMGPVSGPWLTAIRRAKNSPAKIRSLLDRFKLEYLLDESDVSALNTELANFFAKDPSKKVRRLAQKRPK